MVRTLSLSIFVVSALFVAWSANAFEDRLIKLSSGKEVKVRIMGPMYSRDNVPSIMLVHTVDGRIDESEALKLAENIWTVLESDVDTHEVNNSTLLIQEAPNPPASAVYHFQYEKPPNGQWRMTWHH